MKILDLKKEKARLTKKWTKKKNLKQSIDYFELLWDCLTFCVFENQEGRTLETLAKEFLTIQLVEIEMPPGIENDNSNFGFKELGFGCLSLGLDLGASTNPDVHTWMTRDEILELHLRVERMRQAIRSGIRKEALIAIAIASGGPRQDEFDFGLACAYTQSQSLVLEKV